MSRKAIDLDKCAAMLVNPQAFTEEGRRKMAGEILALIPALANAFEAMRMGEAWIIDHRAAGGNAATLQILRKSIAELPCGA